MKKKEIKLYYWCPVLSNVATVKAVINSAIATNRYSTDIKATLIDTLSEWKSYNQQIYENKINIKKISSLENFFPTRGIFMRLNYLKIFLSTFFPLLKLIRNEKPDYLVVHLITSLPILLKVIFNFDTKIILRISGFPKLNLFRKILWKIASNKISIITSPTEGTFEYLKKNKIFDHNKIYLLRDPVISINKINKLKKVNISDNFLRKPFILVIGRLSNQKNQKLILQNFQNKEFEKYNLIILGEGELERKIKSLVSKMSLDERVMFVGYNENVYKFLNKAKFLIISSLWEDPGWAMIEAAACNTTVISSDCEHGPNEFLKNGEGGYLFTSNSDKGLISSIREYNLSSEYEIMRKKIFLKKQSNSYTLFKHFTKLRTILLG